MNISKMKNNLQPVLSKSLKIPVEDFLINEVAPNDDPEISSEVTLGRQN